MKWKTLSSEYLLDSNWSKVRKDAYETPNGKVVQPYYVYEFPTWVACFGVTRDNQVVMIRQYRHAVGEVILELPGGCVDNDDKDLQTAAAREMLEETGYSFDSYEYLGKISPNPSTNTNYLHMYLARGGVKTDNQKLDENEEIEIVHYSIDEVKSLLRQNKIVQAMHVSCIMYALEKLGLLQY